MGELMIKHNELTAEEFILLWETVWGQGPALEQTRLAMEHTLFRVSVFDGNQIVAMARVIGDMGLDYYIKDVIVRPEYQGKGIGRALTEACIECARAAGYLQLELEVVAGNRRAEELYKSVGFVEYGRNPKGFRSRNSGWQENVLMRLEL